MWLFFPLNLCYKLKRAYEILVTMCKVFRQGVIHKHYSTYGIPYFSIESGTISWGENFTMNNGMSGNQIGYNSPCIFRCEHGNIIIGDNVGISQTALIAKDADILIKNNVKIGGGVKLYTTDFHSLNYLYRQRWEIDRENRRAISIVLEDDCFIGAGTIILKGVTVGARSIIGAGSVLTKSVPADEIWAGNPAKFIKRIDDDTNI